MGPVDGVPTAPPKDAPACAQRLSLHGLRCLQRFHMKHQHDALLREEALLIGFGGLICSRRSYTNWVDVRGCGLVKSFFCIVFFFFFFFGGGAGLGPVRVVVVMLDQLKFEIQLTEAHKDE